VVPGENEGIVEWFLVPVSVAANMEPESDAEVRRPRLVRRSPLKPAPKLCPRCLHPVKNASKLGGWLIPMSYHCPNCGYSGTAFLERTSSEEGREES